MNFLCKDCNLDVDKEYFYMLFDHIWPHENGEKLQGLLCVKCLEKRLGRELTRQDFNWTVPLNYFCEGSELLEARKNWPERWNLTMEELKFYIR